MNLKKKEFNISNFFNLHYGKGFKWLRALGKEVLSALYPIYKLCQEMPIVESIPDTIRRIINTKASIARFGDSEMLYISDNLDLPYQKYDERLSGILKDILKSNEEHFLVGLPQGYRDPAVFDRDSEKFWRGQIVYNFSRIKKYLNLNKVYYNATITRLYYGFKDQKKSSLNFDLIKEIWKDRDIVIIEGEKSRLGVGNDLFASTNTVKRVLGPYHNAFSQFDSLIDCASQFSKGTLFLVAMGPTAKAISYTLFNRGFQAIDIGNLDLEYEWYKRGVKERIIIEGKYVSEVKGGRVVSDTKDKIYNSQIVAKYL